MRTRTAKRTRPADLRFEEISPGLFTFRPATARGRKWTEANVILEPWQWQGGRFVVESLRCAAELAEGARADGLSVRPE